MIKMRLFKGFGAMLFAWAMFIVPANAITIVTLTDGASVNLLDADVFIFDPAISVNSGPIGFSFLFTVAAADAPQYALAAELTQTGFGAVTGQSLTWEDTTGILSAAVFSPTLSGSEGSAFTSFVSGSNLVQTLRLSFASITAPIGISLQISAVPIPPALLLFGTPIFGLALSSLRRRRKNKNGLKAVTA